MNNILKKHQLVWSQKTLLREIYHDFYRQIISQLSSISGKTLEIGSGSGNFKEFYPNIISSDIDHQLWLDMHFDAHKLPFKEGELVNIVMVDVFHHLRNPIIFLNEAYRALKSGGKIIMVEPYPSFISKIIYKLFHPEPFAYNVDYFSKKFRGQDKTPWESNQAIPYLFFFKDINKFNSQFRNKFVINKTDKFSFILYPLSGGFENKQFIPNIFIPIIEKLEIFLKPLKNILAFRCLVVIEKI